MTAPLGSILCGLLNRSAVFHATNLDVATSDVGTPSITVDVTANDDLPGAISAPSVISGPAGAAATVVGNQIQFAHNGAGIYVIAYTSTVGILTDTGFLTVTITPTPTGGTPPSAGVSTQFVNTANLNSFSMPVTTPPDARGLFFTLLTWLSVPNTEPQTVTITADYAGTAMTRVDTFGDSISIGDPNALSDPGPVCYSFLLLTPGDTLPASGNISWNVAISGGLAPELHAAYAMFPTHPSRDLTFSELGKLRGSGSAPSVVVNANATAGSLLVNVAGYKGNATVSGDPGWSLDELVNADGSNSFVSGRLLAETLETPTAVTANHTASSAVTNLHSSATYQFSDPLGGGGGSDTPPTGQALTAFASSGGAQITVDMSGAGGSPAGAITAVNVVNGNGVADFSGQDLLFDPPDDDGTTVVEVAYANDAGAVISTVTITTALTLRLDTITGPVSSPTLTADVTSNDTTAGTITNPSITSGPSGGSVAVVGNQIQLTHNGAGVYVIAYTSVIGGQNNPGTLTAVVAAAAAAGSPPAVAPTSYQSSTGNDVAGSTLIVPPGTPLPANTRAVILAIGSWLGFSASEPQTINSLTADYAGNSMTRIDTFGNTIFTGNDGGGATTGTPPAAYVFALLSNGGFSIPTSGAASWNFSLSAGQPELHMAQLIAITHPDRDLTVSELANFRSDGNITATTVNANASANSVALNFSTMKRQVTATGQAGWTTEELVILDHPSVDIQSGRFLGESLVVPTATAVNHTTTTDQANLTGSITIEVTDTGGSGTPPTGQTQTATATTGGGQISIDMSSAGGSPAGSITAANILSGGGIVSFSGQNLLFTPPAADGATEVEVAYANSAGAVISTVTITSSTTSSVALGPRTGPGVGFGQTGTTALTSAVNALIAGTVRPALEAAHDRGQTDQQIRDANPGFTDLLGTTGAALVAEFNAGRRNLILRNDRQYNWSDLGNNQDTPTAGIQLVGLNGANVIAGGAAKNAGQRRWQIRGNVRLEGIDFRDGAILLSANGLTSTVNEVSIRHCKSTNMANLFHHELDNGVSDNLVINQLTIRNNICVNVRDGVNARLGNGLTGPLGTVVNADIRDNIVDGWTRYGIALHYDTPPAGFNYNANSTCLVQGNLITNSDVPTANCFTIATAAFRTQNVLGNWLINNSRHGVDVDHEAIYTKAFQGEWADNFVWNSGQNDFQGILGMKAQDAASPDSSGTLEVHHNFIGTDQGDTTGMLFVQRDNVDIHSNVLVVGADTTVGTTQSASPFINLQFHNNLIRNNSSTTFGAWGLGGDNSNFTFSNNTWEILGSGTKTMYNLRSSTSSSRPLNDIEINGDTFNAVGSGNYLALFIEERSGAIINPKFLNNQLNNMPRAVVINGGTINGTLAWTGNQHTGQTPATTNNTGSTVATFGAGGGNSF